MPPRERPTRGHRDPSPHRVGADGLFAIHLSISVRVARSSGSGVARPCRFAHSSVTVVAVLLTGNIGRSQDAHSAVPSARRVTPSPQGVAERAKVMLRGLASRTLNESAVATGRGAFSPRASGPRQTQGKDVDAHAP